MKKLILAAFLTLAATAAHAESFSCDATVYTTDEKGDILSAGTPDTSSLYLVELGANVITVSAPPEQAKFYRRGQFYRSLNGAVMSDARANHNPLMQFLVLSPALRKLIAFNNCQRADS